MGLATAQTGLNLTFMPGQGQAQWLQPAYLLADSSERLRVSGGYGLQLNSNTLSVGQLRDALGTIDEAQKDAYLSTLQADSRVRLEQRIAGAVNYRLGALTLGLGFRTRELGRGRLREPGLAGLLLYGNARYQDQTVQGEPAFTLANWQEYSLAGSYALGRLRLGLRAKLLNGRSYQDLRDAELSLYTAPFGEFLDVSGQYRLLQVGAADPASWGWGLDLGGVFTVNENLTLQAALIDLGQIRWQGGQRQASFSLQYAGADLGDLFSFSPDSGLVAGQLDSLQGLVWPEPTAGEQVMALPGRGHLGASYGWAQHELQLALAYGWSEQGLNGLLLHAGYHYAFASWGQAGVNAFAGDLEQAGLGAWVEVNLPLAERYGLALFVSVDQALGLLALDQGRGLSAQAGASLSLR